MTSRLFIALEIPDEILDKIIKIRSELYPQIGPRWERRDKLHVTIKFLGDFENESIPLLKSSLERSLMNLAEFPLSFNKFGMFHFKGEPRVLWLGLNESPELVEIHKNIENCLVDLGIDKDKRKFKPHLTLLRIKGRENLNLLNKFLEYDIKEIKFTASKITLFKSELNRKGSVYSKLKSFNLKQGDKNGER